jgi:hypothetical protein
MLFSNVKKYGNLSYNKTINFLFNVVSGGCSSEYLATAALVEKVDHLFDSFNGGTRVAHSAITVPIWIIGKKQVSV